MAEKRASKKVATKKAATKKTATKAAAKTAVKKTASKAPVKKTPAKTAVKKKAPAKKAAPAAKKAAKPAARKKATKKAAPKTSVIAKIDVGFGNALFIRGEGAGLSWDKGLPMDCVADSEWKFVTSSATSGIVFKFLVNDETWTEGEDLTVPAGGTLVIEPTF